MGCSRGMVAVVFCLAIAVCSSAIADLRTFDDRRAIERDCGEMQPGAREGENEYANYSECSCNFSERAPSWTGFMGEAVRAIAFDGANGHVIAGSNNGIVRLFDFNGSVIKEQEVAGMVNSVGACGGKIVAATSVIYCFTSALGPQWQFDTCSTSVRLGFSSNGYFVAGDSNGNVRLFSVGSANPIWTHKLPNYISSVAIADDAKYVAVGCSDGNICLLGRTGNVEKLVKTGFAGSVALSSDGRYFVYGSDRLYVYDMNNASELWNVSLGEKIFRIAYSAYANVIAACDLGKTLHLFDISNSSSYAELPLLGDVEALELSRDGRMMAVCDRSGNVSFFDYLSPCMPRPGDEIVFNPSGPTITPKWFYKAESWVLSCDIYDGNVAVGGMDGFVYLFRNTTTSGLGERLFVNINTSITRAYSGEVFNVVVTVTNGTAPVKDAEVTLGAIHGTIVQTIGMTNESGIFTTDCTTGYLDEQNWCRVAATARLGDSIGTGLATVTLLPMIRPLEIEVYLVPNTNHVVATTTSGHVPLGGANVVLQFTNAFVRNITGATGDDGNFFTTITSQNTKDPVEVLARAWKSGYDNAVKETTLVLGEIYSKKAVSNVFPTTILLIGVAALLAISPVAAYALRVRKKNDISERRTLTNKEKSKGKRRKWKRGKGKRRDVESGRLGKL